MAGAQYTDPDDLDDLDYKPRSRMIADFIMFRGMIVPSLIRFLFWVAVGLDILVGVLALFGSVAALLQGDISLFIGGLFMAIFGTLLILLLVRVYAELVIVVFRIYESQLAQENLLKQLVQGQKSGG